MTSLKFGTSGLRGLTTELAGQPAQHHVRAFVEHLLAKGATRSGDPLFVGRDLRASSPAIAADCCAATAAAGLRPIDCGALPTPALAMHAMAHNSAAIMVTGSHIPADRNGLKFYTPQGEIGKADEAEISRRAAGLPAGLAPAVNAATTDVTPAYLNRYAHCFDSDGLGGLRVGFYQHSSVARDLLVPLLRGFGAETISFGRADQFVAVDTETLDPDIAAQLRSWATTGRLDAIISTDGDADRPLVADENGAPLRGDLIGLMTALTLMPDCVITPVSSNSAITSAFGFEVIRTRIGSPHVIAAMQQNSRTSLGFEANGGVLTGSAFRLGAALLPALPTRDAVLPILCALAFAKQNQLPLSALHKHLGLTHAISGLIRDGTFESINGFVQTLDGTTLSQMLDGLGTIDSIDRTDGPRCLLANGSVVHFRPSGNAPELRIYIEAASAPAAGDLLRQVEARVRSLLEVV